MPLENILVDQDFCLKPIIPPKAIQRSLVATYEANRDSLFRNFVGGRLNSFTDLLTRLEASANIQQLQLAASPQSAAFPWLSSRCFML